MSRSRSTLLSAAWLVAACMSTAAPGSMARAESEETEVRQHVTVTQSDLTAAGNVNAAFFHVHEANVPGARERAAALHEENAKHLVESGLAQPREETVKPLALTGPYFYPGDVKKGTGAALVTTTQHALYVDYTGTVAANWGNPEQFLKDLNVSTFIHVVDQYAGSKANSRYPVGGNASVTYSFYGNVIYEHEIWAIVHAAAVHYGSGTAHLYHVFLPKGVDTCIDLTTSCYSPDNANTWTFCAYHESVNFGSPLGTVYFSVEPYQDVSGCAEATPSSPNGQLADSTNSSLSHETFESISDPIPGLGYFNQSTPFYGNEIGDECLSLLNSLGDSLDPTLILNGKSYKAQLEYSNTYHACASVP